MKRKLNSFNVSLIAISGSSGFISFERGSIYIGIPFCPTKCAYCTFPAYAINGRQGSVDSFLGGLHYEVREIGKF